MKTNRSILIQSGVLLAMFVNVAKSQTLTPPCHTITVDARTGVITNQPEYVKYAQSVCFKFTGINPLLTKPAISSKSYNFETVVPTLFSDLIGAPDTKLIEATKALEEASTKVNSGINKVKSEATFAQLKNFSGKVLELETLVKSLQAFDSISPESLTETDKTNFKKLYDEVQKKVTEVSREISEVNKKQGEISTALESLAASLKTYDTKLKEIQKLLDIRTVLQDHKLKFMKAYDSLNRSINHLSNLLKIESYIRTQLKANVVDSHLVNNNLRDYMLSLCHLTRRNTLTDEKVQELRNSANITINNIGALYNQLSYSFDTLALTLQDESLNLKGDLKDGTKNVTLSINSASVTVKRKKYFEEEYNYATRQFKLFQIDSVRTNIVRGINAGIDLYSETVHSDYSVSQGPFQICADSKDFELKLKNSKGETISEFNPTTITIKTYGHMKVDLSAGYGGALIGDDDYSFFYDASGAVAGVKSNTPEFWTHSIICMFNAYWQSRCRIKSGISFGFSLPTENKFNFFAGYSAHFFEKNRVVVTLGISMIQVNRLNTSQLTVGEDHTYYSIPGNELREIPYRKVYRPAAFFGLTYNLVNLKK